METEGKYIYGIIGTDGVRNFGPVGIGGRDDTVSTISYQDISAVISNFPMGRYELSRANLIGHQRVVERVMKEYAVLPVRAFTVAANAEEVRDFLRKRYRELTRLLKEFDNKIELGLSAYWKDMASIFQEIVDENKDIRQLKQAIVSSPNPNSINQKIILGGMVERAIKVKKEKEQEEIIHPLKRIAADICRNEASGDAMVLNAAFLVDRSSEKEFDIRVDELDQKYGARLKFKYVGPLPPYNFVTSNI